MKRLIFIGTMIIASASIIVVAEDIQSDVSKETSVNKDVANKPELTAEQKRYMDIVNSPEYANYLRVDIGETNTNSTSEKTNQSHVLEETPLEVTSNWRKENTKNIHNPWEGKTTELPDDVPEVAKFFETIGVIIDTYNEEKLADTLIFLDTQWETAKVNFKKKPHPYKKWPLTIFYERENKESPLDLRSIMHLYQDVSPSPQLLFPATVNVSDLVFRDGELIAAISENPAISEEYTCLLRRVKDGFQFCSFVPHDYQGEGTPWITWNKEWKITKRVTKKLFTNDYDFSDPPRILLKDPNTL